MVMSTEGGVAIPEVQRSKFTRRWDAGSPELMAGTSEQAWAGVGVGCHQIEAACFGCRSDGINVGGASIAAAMARRQQTIPVSHVENTCATAAEALRGAVSAVARGACNIARAIGGAETLGDSGSTLRGACARQLSRPTSGRTRNVGGVSYQCIAATSTLRLAA